MKKLLSILLITAMLLSMFVVNAENESVQDSSTQSDTYASYPPVYSTGTDDKIGDYIHAPYVQKNYNQGATVAHDAVTADSGRYIVIDTEWYIPKNSQYWRTGMNLNTLTKTSGEELDLASASRFLFLITLTNGEINISDYSDKSKNVTIKNVFKIGEWNNIRVIIDRETYTRKIIVNNTLCPNKDGSSYDFGISPDGCTNFTLKANQLTAPKLTKAKISSASVLDATETDTTPYVNFHLNSFETCDITKFVGYQVSNTDTTNGTYNARLVATLKLPSAFTLQDLSSVGFKVTATYGENGGESKTVTKTTTNVYSSVAGYTNGETEVQAYTADALGGDYLFVLPILNIPTSAGTVTLKVTTFCTFGTGEIVASEQTVTIDTTNTSLD